MSRLLFIIATFAITGATATVADQKAVDPVVEKLRGRWELVAGTNQGREMSFTEVDGTYVTILNNEITTFDADDRERYRAVFSIDPKKKPTWITMRAVPNKPQLGQRLPGESLIDGRKTSKAISLGILMFESQDRCVLCYALPGGDRPEKFHSPQGSKIMLFTLERRETDPVTTSKK